MTRALTMCAGAGLVAGFFMPWLKLGDVASMSGLSLAVSSGSMVDVLAGPARAMLFFVPISGVAMMACAVLGPVAAARAALVSGALIMLFGFYTLMTVFIDTTGLGTWVVVASALGAAAVGLAARGRSAGR